MVVILETPRLFLRHLVMDDLDELFALYRNPEIRRVIDTPRTNAEEVEYEKEVAMLREMLGNGFDKKWHVGKGLLLDEAIEFALIE